MYRCVSLRITPPRCHVYRCAILPRQSGVFGGFLFISVLAVLGGFTFRDLRFYWNAVNPREMTTYIGEELSGEYDTIKRN